jgi:hypothetical protein
MSILLIGVTRVEGAELVTLQAPVLHAQALQARRQWGGELRCAAGGTRRGQPFGPGRYSMTRITG